MTYIRDLKTNDLNKINGVAIGIITDNKDSTGLGRVKLKLPWRDSSEETWARIAVPMAGNDRGTYFIPEVGDEVLIAFEHGDTRTPYVIGSLWNSKDRPPDQNQSGNNDRRLIKSRSGHQVVLNDAKGKETVEIHTKGGHQIILDDSSGGEKIEVKDKTGNNSILIDSNQNSIDIKSQMKISIHAQTIEIKANSSLNMETSGTLTLSGAVIKTTKTTKRRAAERVRKDN